MLIVQNYFLKIILMKKWGIRMENMKKQLHHLLKGEAIELVPVTKEHIEFICDEESNEDLWCYEEHVETNKDCIRKKFIKRIKKMMFLIL